MGWYWRLVVLTAMNFKYKTASVEACAVRSWVIVRMDRLDLQKAWLEWYCDLNFFRGNDEFPCYKKIQIDS